MKKNNFKLILTAVLFLLFSNSVFSQLSGTYTIDYQTPTSGNNYQTFGDAITALSAGISSNVVFQVKAGTYDEQLSFNNINSPGTDTITFEPHPGNTEPVNIVKTTTGNVVYIANSKKIYFNQINFDGTSSMDNTINLDGSMGDISDISFNNCNITASTNATNAIAYSGMSSYLENLTINDCTIQGGDNSVEVIGLNDGDVSNISIENCTLTDFGSTGIDINYATPVSINSNIIRGNTTSAMGQVGIYLSNSDAVSNSNYITNNMISIQNQSTSMSNNCIVLDAVTHTKLYYNSMSLLSGDINSSILYVTNGTNNELFNNIFYSNIDGIFAFNYETQDVFSSMDHNLYDLNSYNFAQVGGSYYYNLTEWQNQVSQEVNSIEGKANFIDPFTDLHISTAGSVASNKGIPTSVTNDINGDPRDASTPDIGADEGNFPEWQAGKVWDSQWTGNVIVGGNVIIPENSTLFIPGNTHIQFAGNYSINVDGAIVATADDDIANRISFEPHAQNTDGWSGISLSTIANTSTSTFRNCKFTGVVSDDPQKAAIIINDNDSVIIDFCEFSTNDTYSGAVVINNSSVDIVNSLFDNNTSQTNGAGAIFINNGSEVDTVRIKECDFSLNVGGGTSSSGAINVNSGYISILNSKFINNSAASSWYGGAIYLSEIDTDSKIMNNLFAKNTADNGGGAIYLSIYSGQLIEIWNNTFYNNTATTQGADVSCYMNDTEELSLYNNIFTNYGGSNSILIQTSMGGILYTYNNLFSENEVTAINSAATHTPVANIYSTDPLLVNPTAGDFHLKINSPCVNAGGYTGNIPAYEIDLNGDPRISCNTVDIGAVEFQGCPVIANAGPDQQDCSNTFTLAAGTLGTGEEGTWSVADDDSEGAFADISDPSTTVSDVRANFANSYIWTVTDGFNTVSDTVLITNLQPIADAGEDLYLINDLYGTPFEPATLAANTVGLPAVGMWSIVSINPMPASSEMPVIGSISVPTTTLSPIPYGETVLRWTVTNTGCANSDDIVIVAGYNFIPTNPGTPFNWGDPTGWQAGHVPGSADSVTIYGGTVNIPGDALCDRLVLGDGTILNMEGTAKGPVSLSARSIFLEQNAQKFKGYRGAPELHVKANSTLKVGSSYMSKNRAAGSDGLLIGAGAKVFIEPNAQKGSGGELRVGAGAKVFIEPNAQKGSGGELRVGAGAKVFIEPNAQKGVASSDGILIGAGAKVFIEPNAQKGIGGAVYVGSGRRIFLEPNAQKATGGELRLGKGAKVFIEPNAQKVNPNENQGIYVGQNSEVIVESGSEADPTRLITPVLTVRNGIVRVGTTGKQKAGDDAVLEFRKIFIEPNAQKGLSTDTSIIINPGGSIVLSDSAYSGTKRIVLESGATMSILEGGSVNFTNSNSEVASLVLKEGSSFIDMNESNVVPTTVEYKFHENQRRFVSFPFANTPQAQLFDNPTIEEWDEATNTWNTVAAASLLKSITGYSVLYSINRNPYVSGNVLSGIQTKQLSATANGWNSVGNPYPSAIDWEKITIPQEISTTYYVYDANIENFRLYQQGGVTLNQGEQYILPQTAFFVNAEGTAPTITFGNESRVHFNAPAKEAKSSGNELTLSISEGLYTDQAYLSFETDASNNYNNQEDALKLQANDEYPVIYTVAGTNNLAINKMLLTANQVSVPLNFEPRMGGYYTINVDNLQFPAGVTVELKDNLNGNLITDLRTNPSVTFSANEGDIPSRFEILIGAGMTGNQEIKDDFFIEIYSNRNDIYINSMTDELNVEIYNISGQLLIQKQITTNGISKISVNYPSGLYLVKATSSEGTHTQKVYIK